jgi:hypothetical protein
LLLAALVVPATAAAAGYTYKVTLNTCAGDVPGLQVKMIKPEGLIPDKFVIDAWGQRSASGNGGWTNSTVKATYTKAVPQQNAKFTWTKGSSYDSSGSGFHRIKYVLKVVDNGNVVATATVFSVAC